MNSELAIELKHVSKQYRSGLFFRRVKKVLSDVSLAIEPGTVTGLLGRNGAGKTTLIRCLLGLQKNDEGQCIILGEESWNASPAVRHRIGFVPQTMDGYIWMRVDQILRYTSAYYKTWDHDLASRLLQQAGIDGWSRLNNLSEGERQKVGIILAVSHHPDLLILDEPVASLDPFSRREFVEMIVEQFVTRDKTVFFSTHITSDIERLAARVALLQDGEIVLHEDLLDLKHRVCRLQIAAKEGLLELVEQIPNKLSTSLSGEGASVVVNELDESFTAELKARGLIVTISELTLEEIFLELTHESR